MVEMLGKSSQLSSFLRLTDYVDSEKLMHLSADVLQGIVCGSDGAYLEHLSKVSGSLIQFVSKPVPGFQVLADNQKSLRSGCAEGLRIVHAIRSAANKAALAFSESISKDEAIKTSVPSALLPTPVKSCRKNQNGGGGGQYSPKPSYHPLFSDPSAVYYPVMLVVAPPNGALLPTPPPEIDDPVVPPMSREMCLEIIKSPYLSAARRRTTPGKTIERLKEHAKSRIAPHSPENRPDDAEPEQNSIPPLPCAQITTTPFDEEISDCLPGVPGARQSKEYKKLRRKISEIDDLVQSNTELDYCQKIKVQQRPKYVEMIRLILKGEVASESGEDEEVAQASMTEEEQTVASTPASEQECVDPEESLNKIVDETIIPIQPRNYKRPKRQIQQQRKVAKHVQPASAAVSLSVDQQQDSTPTAYATVEQISWLVKVWNFLCRLIKDMLRAIHNKI
jgi:hypothetical protein